MITFPSKADLWIDGELKPHPCRVVEVDVKPTHKKDEIGPPQKTGEEVMFRIQYPRNFKVQEQWIKKSRLRRGYG